MAGASKKAKASSLVAKMDAEAESLLASKDKSSLETRIAIFAQVARWVQVRNRISDGEDTSGLLDAYRGTIDQATRALAEREADRIKTINSTVPRHLGRKQRAAKGGSGDNGGAELEALKSRLPAADVGDADDDRGGGGDAGVAIRGANRLVRHDLPGNFDTVFDERRGDDEF